VVRGQEVRGPEVALERAACGPPRDRPAEDVVDRALRPGRRQAVEVVDDDDRRLGLRDVAGGDPDEKGFRALVQLRPVTVRGPRFGTP
jgi:hypothetical protein